MKRKTQRKQSAGNFWIGEEDKNYYTKLKQAGL